MNKKTHLLKNNKPVKLYLAPMEGLGNYPFRNAISLIGGFDEATKEFISVPKNAHAKSLAKKYNPHDCAPIAQAAQIMGSDIDCLANVTKELIQLGAPRVELNVGCPSNTVTGKGSGSSLLQYPEHLHKILKKMVEVSSVPVSAKLRTGYLDTSLFKENLLACEEANVCHITLHGRTKVEGYKGFASLDLIKQAKELLSIPLIGNGDIVSYESAKKMLEYTNCDGLMIGRGAVINPFIFHEIRLQTEIDTIDNYLLFLQRFYENVEKFPSKNKVGQLKQLFSFLFQRKTSLQNERKNMLRSKITCPKEFFSFACDLFLTNICM